MPQLAPATKQRRVLPAKSTADREREFREAVERVFRQYGSDLSAFLKAVQKERELVKKG